MSKPPSVSVVLTTYNREKTLPSTLDSILCQTFPDFELIICDDASPDGTPHVARHYMERDPRVRYHRNELNIGMPANLNNGIRLAKAQFVANLHDGDLYDPTLLEKWTAALRQSPDVAFVFNQYRHLDDEGGVKRITFEDLPSVFPGWRLIETIYFRRWRFDSPVWGTVMARRAFYEKAGLFDHRFSFFSDVDMWLRLAEDYDVAYVPEPLIALASRKTVPTMINVPNKDEIVRRMLWEARMRHYRLNPARRGIEAVKHGVFVSSLKIYRLLCETKATLLRNIPKHI